MPKVNAELAEETEALVTAIRQHAEAAKTVVGGVTDSQTLVAAALTDAQAKVTEITTAATAATAAQTKIIDLQTVIASKSEHIQGAQEHADKVRADLDRKLTEATQKATEAEGLRVRVQSAADSATELLASVQASKTTAESEAESVSAALKTAEDANEKTGKLADKAESIETRVAEYETRLQDLLDASADRLKTIDQLLPGATSTGLAHSLDKRRQTFLKPHSRWQWIFIGSLILIVIVAVNGLVHVYNMGHVPTYDELVRLWLARLPVAGALLWLALHASREAALAKRIEEDYGFKAAIASSFEGFRRQMAEVEVNFDSESPLAKLCADTLRTIAAPPGRIYDAHKLTVSPVDELKEYTKTVADAAKPVLDAARKIKGVGQV